MAKSSLDLQIMSGQLHLVANLGNRHEIFASRETHFPVRMLCVPEMEFQVASGNLFVSENASDLDDLENEVKVIDMDIVERLSVDSSYDITISGPSNAVTVWDVKEPVSSNVRMSVLSNNVRLQRNNDIRELDSCNYGKTGSDMRIPVSQVCPLVTTVPVQVPGRRYSFEVLSDNDSDLMEYHRNNDQAVPDISMDTCRDGCTYAPEDIAGDSTIRLKGSLGDTAEDISGDITKCASEDITKDITEDIANDIPGNISEDVPKDISAQAKGYSCSDSPTVTTPLGLLNRVLTERFSLRKKKKQKTKELCNSDHGKDHNKQTGMKQNVRRPSNDRIFRKFTSPKKSKTCSKQNDMCYNTSGVASSWSEPCLAKHSCSNSDGVIPKKVIPCSSHRMLNQTATSVITSSSHTVLSTTESSSHIMSSCTVANTSSQRTLSTQQSLISQTLPKDSSKSEDNGLLSSTVITSSCHRTSISVPSSQTLPTELSTTCCGNIVYVSNKTFSTSNRALSASLPLSETPPKELSVEHGGSKTSENLLFESQNISSQTPPNELSTRDVGSCRSSSNSKNLSFEASQPHEYVVITPPRVCIVIEARAVHRSSRRPADGATEGEDSQTTNGIEASIGTPDEDAVSIKQPVCIQDVHEDVLYSGTAIWTGEYCFSSVYCIV